MYTYLMFYARRSQAYVIVKSLDMQVHRAKRIVPSKLDR